MQKGNTLIFLLIGIVALASVAGGAYYLGTKKSTAPVLSPSPIVTYQTPTPSPTSNPTPTPSETTSKRCTTNSDCSSDEVCSDGNTCSSPDANGVSHCTMIFYNTKICLKKCQSDNDCPANHKCNLYRCL